MLLLDVQQRLDTLPGILARLVEASDVVLVVLLPVIAQLAHLCPKAGSDLAGLLERFLLVVFQRLMANAIELLLDSGGQAGDSIEQTPGFFLLIHLTLDRIRK